MMPCSRYSYIATIQVILVFMIHSCESQTVVVRTRSGPIRGSVTTVTDVNLYLFRGIPFAEPPVGDLRFQKPVQATPWMSELDATNFKGSCPQSIPLSKVYYDVLPNKNISEDCLFINVYVPRSLQPQSRRSVLVWIHGGGYTIGQGMLYDGTAMAITGDVIVVSFNYRLGILGFMSTGDSASPGNYGLWDQILALKWVKQNIASFGGDPDSVTIFGESSGGFSVGLQMMIPQNKGLYKRAIAESGSGTSFISLRTNPLKTSTAYAKFLNCSETELTNTTELVSCLKQQSTDNLILAQSTFGIPHFDKTQFAGGPLGPVQDGDLFMQPPLHALKNKSSEVYLFFKSLDIMVGNVNAEGSLILFGLFPLQKMFNFDISKGVPTKVLCELFAPDLTSQYYGNDKGAADAICQQYSSTDMAQQGQLITEMYADCFFVVPTIRSLDVHSMENSLTKSYQFLFTRHVPLIGGLPEPAWFQGAPHESELFFLFRPGTLQHIHNITVNPAEDELSFIMMKYWSNFAKTGNPNSDDVPYWPPYNKNDRPYIKLDLQVRAQTHVYPDRVKFWLDDMPSSTADKYSDPSLIG